MWWPDSIGLAFYGFFLDYIADNVRVPRRNHILGGVKYFIAVYSDFYRRKRVLYLRLLATIDDVPVDYR
jgi:hypothetical protein